MTALSLVVHPLDSQELALLASHENTITLGYQVFIAVGNALIDIQTRKLYRAQGRSLQAYLENRWPDLGLRRAYQFIGAAQTVNKLYTVGSDWQPGNEAQARALAGLSARDLQVVATVAQEMSADGRIVSAAVVRSLVNVLHEIVATGAVDDGTGEQIPAARVSVQHLKAAVIEETYERMQRQGGYIRENSDWTRVDTLVVTTDAGLQAAIEAMTSAFEASGKVKVSYYLEKETT